MLDGVAPTELQLLRWETVLFPALLFLGLYEKTKENLKNTKQEFLSPCEPLETLKEKQKTLTKTKGFRRKKNTKETKHQGKEEQGWRFDVEHLEKWSKVVARSGRRDAPLKNSIKFSINNQCWFPNDPQYQPQPCEIVGPTINEQV